MLGTHQIVTTKAIRKFRRQFASKAKAAKAQNQVPPDAVASATQEAVKEQPTPPPKPPAPRLIFGLGNPGNEFKATRHNIGFLCVDTLAQSLGLEFSQSKYSSDYAGAIFHSAASAIASPN
jgi:hypothetical protein